YIISNIYASKQLIYIQSFPYFFYLFYFAFYHTATFLNIQFTVANDTDTYRIYISYLFNILESRKGLDLYVNMHNKDMMND
ncbi:MAG: hypothetical protein ACTHKF_01755, partial [Candidatus Nitrosocosmicus sp.]